MKAANLSPGWRASGSKIIRARRWCDQARSQFFAAPLDRPERFALAGMLSAQTRPGGLAALGAGGDGLSLYGQFSVRLLPALFQCDELIFDRSSGRRVHVILQRHATVGVQRDSTFGSGSDRPRQAGASLRQSQTTASS